MPKINIRYWICQVLGWGGWMMVNIFFIYLFAHDVYFEPAEKRKVFYAAIFIEFIWSILSTHLFRLVLQRLHWMRLPNRKVILLFIFGVIITSFVSYYGARVTAVLSNNSLVDYEKKEDLQKAIGKEEELGLAGTTYFNFPEVKTEQNKSVFEHAESIKRTTGWYRDKKGNWQFEDPEKGRFWWNIILTFILTALWLLLYLVWHYLEKDRNTQLDKLKLEKNVKELELKTIKSHINPHFIFNSLNSIRALVDENPARARTAITELSNILRSSMQVEKMETVSLNKELDIVKDYLALEHMRFEERLKIEMYIDENTLQQPVPPMMLQTLVENAIKHGISKHINGGFVKIISLFSNNNHELFVQNSGHIEGEINSDGFGIKSTRDRLKLLYQGKASFEIKNVDGYMVQSKIIMPVIH